MSSSKRTRADRTPVAGLVAIVATLSLVFSGAFIAAVPVAATAAGVVAADEVATDATAPADAKATTPDPSTSPVEPAAASAEVTPSADPGAKPSDEAKPTEDAKPTDAAKPTDEATPAEETKPTDEPSACPTATNDDDTAVESEATVACAQEAEKAKEAADAAGTIGSDKPAYAPGATVVLAGSGWTADGAVAVEVAGNGTTVHSTGNGTTVHSTKVEVTGSGSVFTTFTLPTAYIPSFTVTATGLDSKLTAKGSFTETLADVSIASDLADYPPGGLVTLTGSGWLGDDTVRVVVNDTLGRSWQRDVNVAVGTDGVITDAFNLPDYFVSDYDATATGLQTGRVAATTFTDANAASITVRKGGKRTGTSTVENLADATFVAYAKGVGSNGMSSDLNIPVGATPVATCTTNGTGTCVLNVTWNSATTGTNRDAARFLVVEQTAPTGYTVITDISTSDGNLYRFNQQVANSGTYTLPSTDRWWANRKDNPAWPGRCGMNIAMLFDESTSISDSEFDQMQTAAKGFVNALKGTPSRIAVFSFSTNAPANNSKPLTSIQSDADATAMNTWIDGMTQAGGFTNWDAGLYQIAQSAESFDVVLFLTDGDPTRYGTPASGSGTDTTIRFVEEAVHSANAVKAKSNGAGGFTRIVGVGIGVPSGSEKNLAAVTGTTVNSDYFTTSFAALEAKLKEIASLQCGGSILISKTIGTALPGALDVESNGWTFDTAITSGGGTATPASGQTANVNNFDGQLQVKLADGTWPKTVTVTETSMKPNFSFVDLQCTGATNVTKDSANRKVTLTIASGATVSCTFVNNRHTGTLKIVKTLDKGGSAFSGTFNIDYSCTATGRPNKTGSVAITNAGETTVAIPAGYTCTVTEQTRPAAPDGYVWNTPIPITFVPAGGAITKDQTTTATVANILTANNGTLALAKSLSGGPTGYTGPFTIGYSCTKSGQTTIAGTKSVTAGGTAATVDVPTGYQCLISETPPTAPTGYTFGTPTFSPSATVQVTAGTTVTVTTNNTLTRDQGVLALAKSLSGGPTGYTGPFTIGYSCTMSGQPTIAGTKSVTTGGTAATVDVPTGYQCVISETPPTAPTGYTFGTPTFSPSSTVPITTKGATVTVTTNNTLTRDGGVLALAKSLTGGPSGYTGPFTIGYSCTMSGQSTIAGTKSVSSGGAAATVDVPTGYQCVISETPPTAPTGYTFGTPTFSPSSTVAITTKGATVTVTTNNTLTRDGGTLALAKSLSGGPTGYTGPFTIGYSCTMSGQSTIAGTKSVTAGGTAATVDVPTGYQCVISETPPTAPTGYTFGTPTFSPSSTVDITTKGATVTVTTNNTLTRDQGTLSLLKTLSGGPQGYSPQFGVGYSCTLAGQPTIADTVLLTAGGAASTVTVPTGYSCLISEPTLPTPPADYSFGTPTFVPTNPVVITTKATTYTVTTVNTLTRDVGSLTINKALNDPDGSGFAGTFSIGWSCVLDGNTTSGTVSLVAGGSQTIPGIPTRSVCTVTEPTLPTAPTGFTFGTPTFSPSSSVTITTKGTAYSVTVNNSIARDRGSLVLAKTLSGGPQGYTGPFSISYACTITGGPAINGSELVNAGSSVSVTGIPTGYQCIVSEPTLPTAPTGYTFGTPAFDPVNRTATIGSVPVTVTVANALTRDTGTLSLAKSLTGGPSGYTGPFTIGYSCTMTGQPTIADTVSVNAAGTPASVTVPTGYSCTISETPPTAPTGYTFGTPTFSPSGTVPITTKGATVTVTTNNTLTRDMGVLSLAKALNGGPQGYTGPFTVAYSCTMTGETTIAGTKSVTAGGTAATVDVPTGYQCVVSEPTLPTAPQGYTFGTPTFSPSSTVDITTKGATVTVTTNNTLTRDQGTFRITKSVTGGPVGHEQAGDFDITYTCLAPQWASSEGTVSATVQLADGESSDLTLNTGYTCTVVEDLGTRPAPPTFWSWGAPTFSPASVTVVNGQTGTLTVVNPLDRDLGSLDVAKVLVNPDQANAQTSFTVDVVCTFDGATSATFNGVVVTAGQTTRLGSIPTGSTCVVTERAPTPVPDHSWAVSVSPATSVAVETEQTPLVTVTNTITRDRGTLTITKTLSGPAAGPFSINVVCVPTPESSPSPSEQARALTLDGDVYSGTFVIPAGGTETVTGIPTGYTCTVTEPTLPGAPSGYTWATPTISPNGGVVTIDTRDQVVAVTVANVLNSVPPPPTPTPAPPTPTPVTPTPEPILPTPIPTVEPTPEPILPTPAPVEPTPEPANPVIPVSVPAGEGDGPLGLPLWSWMLLVAGALGVLTAGIRLATGRKER